MSVSATDRTLPSVQRSLHNFFANYWGLTLIFASAVFILPCYVTTIECLMSKNPVAWVCLVFFLIFYFAMTLWSFYKTNRARIPTVPERFSFTKDEFLFVEEYEKTTAEARRAMQSRFNVMAKERGIRSRCRDGTVNYCRNCRLLKPERAHHCSVCNKCVIRMDHHCPFFGNCIHFSNHKFFLLTLFYASMGTLYIVITGIACLSKKDTLPECSGGKFFFFGAMTFYCGILAMMVTLFFLFSMKQAMCNETTLESMSELTFADGLRHTYDVGSVRENLQQILGPMSILWLIPVEVPLMEPWKFPLRAKMTSEG